MMFLAQIKARSTRPLAAAANLCLREGRRSGSSLKPQFAVETHRASNYGDWGPPGS
jgi:hypothetical protein